MSAEWVLTSETMWATIVVGTILAVLLAIGLKRDLSASRVRVRAPEPKPEPTRPAENLPAITDRAPIPEEIPFIPTVGQSINLTKRARALRMHRRGEAAGVIAAALQAPRQEVELLLKVDRLLQKRA